MSNENVFLSDMNNFFSQQPPSPQGSLETVEPQNNAQMTVLDTFYQKLADMGMNLDELKPILESTGNTLILSGAGAGKTTTLTLKIIRGLLSGELMSMTTVQTAHGLQHIQTPAKILVSTFLKTGAQDLQASLREWCEKLGIVGVDFSNIQFKTIHAEVKDAITKMGAHVNILTDTSSLVRSVANKYGIRSLNATTRTLGQEEVNELSSIMAFARNRLDDKRYDHQLAQEYGLDPTMLDAFLKDFKIFRQASGGMDFEDMQEMLLEALKINPNVEKFIMERYDYIFVDEFQDTSQLQYELLKYYFKGAKAVTVVGDSDQAIYSFRGSDNEIIKTTFLNDFNPTVLNLSTNYRCRSNILEAVKPSIMLNGSPHSKLLRSAKEGGEVNVLYDADVNHMIQSIKSDLIRNYSVGVMARTNADLLIPALILELDGSIEYGVSKSVNLNGRMAKQIFGMIDLVTKRVSNDFENLLRTFLKRYEWHEAERLYNVLVANRGMSIYSIPDEDLRHSVPKLYPVLNGLRQAHEMGGGVEAFLYLLGVLEQKVFVGSSIYVKKARDLTHLVSKLITEHEKLQGLSIMEIDVLFRSTLPERLARRAKYSQNPRVKLTTVHEAKGKEWDSAYVYNDVEGAFPNQVGNRELTNDEFEEERRVHYIAWTRAKDKLTVYTSIANMGTFLKECDLSQANQSVTKGEEPSKQVFKRKASSGVEDTFLKAKQSIIAYTEDVRGSGTITDDRVANLEIVLNAMSLDDFVRQAHDNYSIGQIDEPQDVVFDTLENLCKKLADDIIIQGTYSNY